MRQLTTQRGLTLVELLVALTIAAILLVAGLPAYADYIANARLREGANLMVTAGQFARSEAIKRNHSLQLGISGGRIEVSQTDGVGGSSVTTVLRSFEVPATLQASGLSASFDSTGRLTPFGTQLTVTVSSIDRPCSADLRCPAVHIDAGGTTSLCRTGTCP